MPIPLRAGKSGRLGPPTRLAKPVFPVSLPLSLLLLVAGGGACDDDKVRDLHYGQDVGGDYTLPDSAPVRDAGAEVAADTGRDAADAGTDGTDGAGADLSGTEMDAVVPDAGPDAPVSTPEVPADDAAVDGADDLAASG
jgi:hypothetical protein